MSLRLTGGSNQRDEDFERDERKFYGDAAARSKPDLQSGPSESDRKSDAKESAIAGLKSLPSPPIDPDNVFHGWPPMPQIKPLELIMSAEELKQKLK